jgi:hypothetical protein
MPLLAPAFREINFQRIRQRIEAGDHAADVAAEINATAAPESPVTADDLTRFLKVQSISSRKMLLRKPRGTHNCQAVNAAV